MSILTATGRPVNHRSLGSLQSTSTTERPANRIDSVKDVTYVMPSVRSASFAAVNGVVILDFDGTVAPWGVEPTLLGKVPDVGDEPIFSSRAATKRWERFIESDLVDSEIAVDLLEAIQNVPAQPIWAGSAGSHANKVLASLTISDPKIGGPWPVLGSTGDERALPNRSFALKLSNVANFARANPTTAIVWADDELGGRMSEALEGLAGLPKGQIRLIVCNGIDGLQPRNVDEMRSYFASVGLEAESSLNSTVHTVPIQRNDRQSHSLA